MPKGVSTVHQHVFPVQSLQPEILAMIFIFCLPEIGRFCDSWGDDQVDPFIASQYAPLLLCNVCSSWRTLAISTPRLWQTLDFIIRRTPLDPEPLAVGIRTWLGRSGTLPLTINLKVFAETDWGLSSQSWQVFEPLFQCASRWERCHLKGILKLPCLQSLPILREIGINLPEIPFTSAPCLKSLSLISLPSTSGSPLSAIPWDQLTELEIEREQLPSMFLDIIRHCPRLQSLSLFLADPEDYVLQPSMLGISGAEVPSSFPITHDTLRYLRLSFWSFPSALLDSIILPALIELECGYYGFEEPPSSFYCPQLLVLFTQSNCQLQKLSLVRHKLTPNELLECLKHQCCQTLTYLKISNDSEDMLTSFDKELLLHLTYSENNKTVPICPKLAQLELYFCYRSHRSYPDLMGRMIQSRCFGRAQGDRLESFKIRSLHSLSKEDCDLFRFAEEKGGLDLWPDPMDVDSEGSTVSQD